MDERLSIFEEMENSGLLNVIGPQYRMVLDAMALFADPDTRELTKSTAEIAKMASQSMPLNQAAGLIKEICASGIVSLISEEDPPTYRINDYQRFVNAKEEEKTRKERGDAPLFRPVVT